VRLCPGQQQRTTRWPYHPFPRQGGEENRKEKAKLAGWDKDSLTEQQRENRTTTRILTKGIHKVQCSHCPMLSSLLNKELPFPSQLPHVNTEHNATWY